MTHSKRPAILVFSTLLCLGQSMLFAQTTADRPEWKKYFDNSGVHGCFMLYDMKKDSLFVYNAARIDSGFIPASTFKIPNSLISLQCGAIAGVDDTIRWDGVNRGRPQWNADQNMRSAIRYSTVWFYQEMARRVGEKRMRHYIDTLNYGNRDMSGGIDMFWLKGGMRITPRQQLSFLEKLYNNELPFPLSVLKIVKEILIIEQTDTYVLRAKTGWGDSGKPEVGWYVGYLERGGNACFFINNIDIWKDDDVASRISITRRILHEAGLIESVETK